MSDIRCSNCRRPYPETGAPYRCPTCGGVYDFERITTSQLETTRPSETGIWRYRSTFPLPEAASPISLGEGNTPLVWAEAFGRQVAFKLEFHNPTGSFKDRNSSVLLTFLKSRGIKEVVEDSSGNAGASLAAYAAFGQMPARVFLPESASGPKRRKIEAYGAQIVAVPGPRSQTAEAVADFVREGAADRDLAYASHAYLPHGLFGYATLAYELVEQLGQAPGTVVAPVGQGGLLLGVGRGFDFLLSSGAIDRLPVLVGVQAEACAPIWAIFQYGSAGFGWVTEGDTLADGVRIKFPVRGDAVLRQVEASGGTFFAIEEGDILPGRDELARRGLYVENTSALVWKALEQTGAFPEPVVAILTGIGLKS